MMTSLRETLTWSSGSSGSTSMQTRRSRGGWKRAEYIFLWWCLFFRLRMQKMGGYPCL
jgi:hypothetical protein